MTKILVTGATGFVGRHLCDILHSRGHEVIGTTRNAASADESTAYDLRAIGDISEEGDWSPVLDGVEQIVHLAARVHVMNEVEEDPLAAFRKVNVLGTERLLRQRGMRNVRRVIFLSTIKVFGDDSVDGPISGSSSPAPGDPYGASKLEAENVVKDIGAAVGFETVVIRPPLVYGPGVGGNFTRLLKLVDGGFPLPFGSVRNLRSLVSVQNLCDLICECLSNESAAGKELLVSDNCDISTPDLVRLVASEMNKSSRLLSVPLNILWLAGRLAGRSAEVSRLVSSLRVDISDTMKILDWEPPISLSDGIRSTVAWYQEQLRDA